jgi:hypothetical protein
MSRYGPDGFPLVDTAGGSSSFRPEIANRLSYASDLSGPSPSLYDPQIKRTESQDFVSPQTSMANIRSHSFIPEDAIDVSHVQLTSQITPIEENQRRFSASSMRLPETFRPGPSPSPSSWSNTNRYSWGQSDYPPRSPIERVASIGRGIAGRLQSIRASRQMSSNQVIPEEGDEMEVRLMGSAYQFGTGGTAYTGVGNLPEEDEGMDNYGVDISSFVGPMSTHDEATVLQFRQLESNGQLTGGLGVGIKPDARISSTALYASSPIEPSGRLSKRNSVLSRASTLRDLGQREANKRGQIIEVVVEESGDTPPVADEEHREAAGVDLSTFGGGSSAKDDFTPGSHNPDFALTRAAQLKRVETFYPVANWKPFSMRWLYLTTLIVISASMSAVQEYLLQRSLSKQATKDVNGKAAPEGLYSFTSPQDVPTWDYFCFKYLPTVLAVTYGVLWQLTDFEVKRLEPYYQLSRPNGALAAESINVDYITIFNFLRPVMALRYKHWAVASCSVASLLAVSVVPVLQSASIILIPDRKDRKPDDVKFVIITPVWSRFLSAVLAIIAVLGCILLYLLQSRRSGLVADVKGIAGIAAMATKSHILMDFKDLDTVHPQEIHNKLKNHRYTLRNSSLAPDASLAVSRQDAHKYDAHKLSQNPHPFMMRLIAGIPVITGMILFAGFLPIVLFVPAASIITDKASFLLTALAVAIKIAYQTIEQDLRMMEPFYRLSCRHASPKVLTLDYTGMAFGYMPFAALANGDFLLALTGFGSVFAEVLTVCVTSFAGVSGVDFLPVPGGGGIGHGRRAEDKDSGEETLLSFWVSFALSGSILCYLVLTAAAVYVKRRHPFLPRQPSTIASVLAYIHQSKMLYDFVDKDETASGSGVGKGRPSASKPRNQAHDNDAMVRRLVVEKKTYGLGWFTGRDGETHCGVDEEELRGDYKHREGGDVRMATKPWLGNWQDY